MQLSQKSLFNRYVQIWSSGLVFLLILGNVSAQEFSGSISSIERHSRYSENVILNPFNSWCNAKTGANVTLPSKYITQYTDPNKHGPKVIMYNLAGLECKGADQMWTMGHIWQGSGGSEWIAVVGQRYLVRFTAIKANGAYSNSGSFVITAYAHPRYCEHKMKECIVVMTLP